MNKERTELLNGTVVYFIGNVLVAILQLLMLKVITGNISSTDYGYYNMIVSIDNLITPVLTLQISDAVFRFIIKDKNDEKSTIYTSGIIVLSTGIIIAALSAIIINCFLYTIPNLSLVVLYISSTNIFMFYQKMARALGNNHIYVIGSLLRAGVYLFLQIITIYFFNLKVESLFLSSIISTFLCIIFLELRLKCYIFFDLKKINKIILINMLKYCLPLVPNTVLWWMSSSFNQVIISSKISYNANGIYTAAGKFGSIVTMISSVFNLAWQESAIKIYGSKNSKFFFKQTYDTFTVGLLSTIIVLIPLMSFFLPYLIDDSYYDAIKYAPFMLVGTAISSMYGFFGQMYSAIGKTKGIMFTTLVGVVSNLIIIFLTIDYLGLWSAVISVVISSFLIMIMRYYEFKEIMELKINKKIVCLLFVLGVMIILYYTNILYINLIVFMVAILLFFIINKALIQDLITIGLKKI